MTLMPDDEQTVKELTEEARKVLLQAIIAYAPDAAPTRLEETARAYALVVGAKWGKLPGAVSVDGS
jgi:hypothetical protein